MELGRRGLLSAAEVPARPQACAATAKPHLLYKEVPRLLEHTPLAPVTALAESHALWRPMRHPSATSSMDLPASRGTAGPGGVGWLYFGRAHP